MFRTTLIVLPLLASLGATAAQEDASQGSSAAAPTSTAPQPSDSAKGPQPISTTSVNSPSFTSVLELYDPTETNVPSDGWVLAPANTTYIRTTTKLTSEEVDNWNKGVQELNALGDEERRWRTALIVMGPVMAITVIFTGVFGHAHRGLRKKWAAERLGQLGPMSAVDHHPQPREDETGLPAYSAERPPSYTSSRGTSTSSLALLVGAATAVPRANAANTYTPAWTVVNITMSTLPGHRSPEYPRARASYLAAIRAVQIGAFVGLLFPCIIMWCYVAYVAVLLRREERKDRIVEQARAHPPVSTGQPAVFHV